MKPSLLYGVLFSAVAMNSFAADPQIFNWKTGTFQVYMLVENRGQGRPGVLVGVSAAQMEHYFPTGSYGSETNTFLVRGGGKTVLIDTGFGGAVLEALKQLKVKPEDVDAILLTHLHGDHTGGLVKGNTATFPNARVYLARQELAAAQTNSRQLLAVYGNRVETFDPSPLGSSSTVSAPEILPGIKAIAAYGHTPGHTVFLVENGGERLFVWGDLMHVQGIQFPLPDIAVTYDSDAAAAIASRREILEYAARYRIPIGGMHLEYPAIGMVEKAGEGFRFIIAR
ncbi:MAG: MBL fold metallo-hydrolase [Treponema sp.]|jgi:glyoxylase-like metal-dependent hydrolase (beta-lactamase superfamily II)|nr:MBL fold metallo-hydrolase [Treponema sp.]